MGRQLSKPLLLRSRKQSQRLSWLASQVTIKVHPFSQPGYHFSSFFSDFHDGLVALSRIVSQASFPRRIRISARCFTRSKGQTRSSGVWNRTLATRRNRRLNLILVSPKPISVVVVLLEFMILELFCRFISFYIRKFPLLWRSTVYTVRKDCSIFMRMYGFYGIPIMSQREFISGRTMKNSSSSTIKYAFLEASICASVDTTQSNIKLAIALLLYGPEKIITTRGKYRYSILPATIVF